MIGILGAGNMGSALAHGWAEPVYASDGGSGRAHRLVAELGGEVVGNAELLEKADPIILAHPPHKLAEIARGARARGKTVISVLGPTRVAELERSFPESKVARAMPNTPVAIRRGVICLAQGGEHAIEFLERVARVFVLPETLMDLGTATAGVMPAYIALIAEAAIDAAVCFGLPYELATDMFLRTLAGSAELMIARGGDTLAARREVASPGESTVRGVATLERYQVRTAFHEATRAVLERLRLPYEGQPVVTAPGEERPATR
jgi:pyrroline-5-carboxylate reductase